MVRTPKSGLMTEADKTKLDTIETNADVTNAVNIASSIQDSLYKNPPVDNDRITIVDSAASFGLKKVLWSNVKSTLKAYFDTLYSTSVHASRHVTGGADTIASAVAAGNAGLMTGADKIKLDGIEALADVTGSNAPQAHGASLHTDITRELYIPVTVSTNGMELAYTFWSAGVLTDGVLTYGSGTFKVPADFVSNGVLNAIIIAGGTGNMSNELRARYGIDGESEAANYNASGATYEPVENGIIEILPNSLALTTLTIGDVVGCTLRRDGANASDTVNGVVHAIGFVFSYTASQ